MKIATVLGVHNDSEVVLDTLDSVLHYMTDDVLVVVDGNFEDFDSLNLPVCKLQGFKHGVAKSPYRNVALGLYSIRKMFPDSDWYCYLEYDCLVTSIRFKYNLEMADKMGVWMLGADGRVDDKSLPIIDSMLKQPLKSSYYLLGACQFFSKSFMQKLDEINFFERFLSVTNNFVNGFMPGYTGYDVSEHLYPSLCRQFGGDIGVFSSWDRDSKKWHGSYEVFPIRWKPEIDPETERFKDSSIIHPLKSYDHPIREHYRKVRYVSKLKKYSSTT